MNHQNHHLILFDREGFFDHLHPCTEVLKRVMETPQMVPAAEVGFPVERNMTVFIAGAYCRSLKRKWMRISESENHTDDFHRPFLLPK